MPSRINLTALLLLVVVLQACSKHNDAAPSIAPPPNSLVETSPPYQKPYTIDINQYIGGFYEALPARYSITTKKYPLIIFLHGYGQVGDGNKDLPLVLNDGIAKEINQLKFPPSFSVNGSNYSFIVLSPQFRAVPPDSCVYSFIQYALKNYRVDSSRIYIAGLSMGGILTTEMAGQHTSLFAAAVPISGESFGDDKDFNAAAIAKGALPLWVLHNSGDPTYSSSIATNFIDLVNSYNPVIAPRLTIFQATGHDAWTQALDPLYKENNMNVYEWMLQYHR